MERPDRLVFPNGRRFHPTVGDQSVYVRHPAHHLFLVFTEKRKRLWRISREHKLLTYCLLYSFCAIPFAPLGIDSAISGVCFFCMFWALFLFQQLLVLFREHRRKKLKPRT